MPLWPLLLVLLLVGALPDYRDIESSVVIVRHHHHWAAPMVFVGGAGTLDPPSVVLSHFYDKDYDIVVANMDSDVHAWTLVKRRTRADDEARPSIYGVRLGTSLKDFPACRTSYCPPGIPFRYENDAPCRCATDSEQ